MSIKRRFLALCLVQLAVGHVVVDEPKNHDKDVICDEAKVPPYALSPLLVSAEGKPITTPEEWFNVRRPLIMSLFGNLVYGIVPSPESPIRTTFEDVFDQPRTASIARWTVART